MRSALAARSVERNELKSMNMLLTICWLALRRRAVVAVLILASLPSPAVETNGTWTKVSESAELTIYARSRSGSAIQELKAVGVIGFEPGVVKRVLDDCEKFPSFLPYVVEAQQISKNKATQVSYQRVSPPMVGDRDYTVRVHYQAIKGGTLMRWEAANDLGPAEKPGVVRVKNTEGSWLLEPTREGRETLATYCVLSDGGGGLPPFVTNWAGKTAVPKLFDAIRKQAAITRYH